MKKTILVFSGIIIALLVLFRLSNYALINKVSLIEWVLVGVAVLFFLIGVVFNRRSLHKKVDLRPADEIDKQKIQDLGLTDREYEILVAMSAGFSNKEIGEQLYISESTIKTHVSNIFVKLDARRRTQAVQIAKELHIL